MGASNDDRANAIADWFARAGTQVSRAKGVAQASKDDVKYRAAQTKQGKATLRQDKARQKNGVKYLPGQAPNENLSAAPTLHLINGKVQKGTANHTGAPDNEDEQTAAPTVSRDEFLKTMFEKQKKDLPALGGLSDIAHDVAKNTPLGDVQNYLFNNSDPLGRPQNAGQAVLNALSAPLYAVAEGAHDVGAAAAANEAKGEEHDTNPLAPSGALGSIGTFLGGAGRGVAEGFGARFDGKTPRTLGQDLEDVGTKKALQGVLGKDAGNTAQGVLGGVADIAGDPSTWFTLGAGAAAKGALSGAREANVAARAAAKEAASAGTSAAEDAAVLAERYAGKPPTPAQIKAVEKATPKPTLGGEPGQTRIEAAAAGARKEFSQAFLRPTFGNPGAATRELNNHQLAKQIKKLSPDTIAEINKLPKAEWQDAILAAASRKKKGEPELVAEDFADTVKPQGIPQGLQGMLNPQAADVRAAGISELLPNITTRGVNAEEALARSTTGGTGALISDSDHAALQTAIATSNTPSNWLSAERSLRNTPAVRDFLDSTMKVGGRDYKVAEVARKLATSDPLSPAYGRFQEALDGAYSQAKGRTGTVDAEQLGTAIADQGITSEVATGDLVDKLNSVPHEARKALLQKMLGGGKTFGSFDAAIQGAIDGQVDATMMRTMLNKLGIATKLRDPKKLSQLLNGQGKTNWEQIKASVRTPQEVLDIHGIDDAAVQAAETTTLEEVMPGIQQHVAEETQRLYGYDPLKIAPLKDARGKITGDSTGAAIFEAQQTLGRRFAKGESTEAYDIASALSAHTSIVKELAQIANVRGLSGDARAAFMLERYRQATRTVESGNIANGIMPRLVDGHNTVDPLFVSWGNILDELPDDVAKRALFSPDFDRKTFAVEKDQEFKKGFTAYPTSIMNGVRAAVGGSDAETVAIMMRMAHGNASMTKKYLPQLDDIYRQVADAITDPRFVERMKTLDAANQPLAYSFSRAAAEGIVTPLSQRILEAIDKAGDQGATRDEIREAIVSSRREAGSAAGYPSLVSDMVQQRMDNGFVNGVLGEYGSLVLNAQERMLQANKVAGAANGARKIAEQSKARVETLNDFLPHINESAGVGRGADEVEELANVENAYELMDGVTGSYVWTQRLGTALSGRYGMDGMKDSLVEGQTTGFLVSATFNKGLREFLYGRKSALTKGRTGGLVDKIAQGLGASAPVDYDTATRYIRDWWSALAVVPPELTGNEMLGALKAGRPTQGLVAGARGLEDWELEHALQLRSFIDQVFNEGDAGLFNRSGLSTRDVMTELRRYSTFKQGGTWEGSLPSAGQAMEDQAHLWRTVDIDKGNPLDLLDQYMSAMSAAGVKPSVAAQVSKLWGRYNPTADEIKHLGLKRLATNAPSADLARYVDPNAYFTPVERRQLAFLQQAMNYSKEFPQGMAPIVRAYDAITRVLKSSATVWRPGHHVTNILGDMFMNLLAGVNPLHIIRATKMLRSWGQMLDADMGPLAELERATRPIGSTVHLAPDAKFGSDYIVVRVNGKAQPISLEEAMTYAHRSGVAMTHAAVMDMAETTTGRVSRSANPLSRAASATIGRADNALAGFSALRDNLTRLPHFIAALEKGDYKSLDEAMAKAAAEVHDYHPTALAGSGFEQKVLRRAFYFYTWTRQAASRIIRTGLDRPGLLTIPSKFQYEMASANGLNPESIGVPFDPQNDNIPDYHHESLLGPTYFGGLTPTPDPEGKTSWGYSLSSPQIDALNTLFEGANATPGQNGFEAAGQQLTSGAAHLVGANLNPLVKAPSVLGFGIDPGNIDPANPSDPVRQSDKLKWLADQGGILTTGAKLTGGYQQAFPGAINPKTNTPYKTAAQVEADRQRALLNALTGMKFTSYDDATSAAVAASQQKARKRLAG